MAVRRHSWRRYLPFCAALLSMSGSSGAGADTHLLSLTEIFPSGKCAPVSPNFELLKHAFAGGEMTELKIYNDKGALVETLTTFVNSARDQWVLVGSKQHEKVIFCLYASGIGPRSVNRKALR